MHPRLEGSSWKLKMEVDFMKIAVCIKQVVTREWQLRVNDGHTWIRDQDASFELNEPDAYALEEALRLKEKHGGEVVVCSAGPARVSQVIREALARGADRAITSKPTRGCSPMRPPWPTQWHPQGADEGSIVSRDAVDDQGSASRVVLAEKLGMPHATIIMEVQATEGRCGSTGSEGGWFRAGTAAAGPVTIRAASISSIRDVEGHHGGQEEGDPQRAPPPAAEPTQRIARV